MQRTPIAKYGRIAAAALFLTLAFLAFSGAATYLAPLLKFQLGPAILSCFAAFSVFSAAIVLILALTAFLFGRFYCSILCPLGILQDIFSFLSRRKASILANLPLVRYTVCGIVFGMLFCGWSTGFLLLEPYSNFGRIAGGFSLGGIAALLVVAALAVWKKRIYCTTICPVGTLLGLFAKHGLFRLSISDRCVRCGKCATICPSGCIDFKNGAIDNERCVRCMNCVSACPPRAIVFRKGGAAVKQDRPANPSRRAFLLQTSALLAGLAVGATLAKTGLTHLADYARKLRILPPGALLPERFAQKCTACLLCVKNCPAHIIVPAPGGDGPVSLDLSRGFCRTNCNRCSQICPTGALTPLPLAVKRRTKIAEAKFDATKCLVFQEGEKCGKCAAACPANAITLRKNTAPRPVKTDLCIGCGACQAVCPAPEKAMTVFAIERQIPPED